MDEVAEQEKETEEVIKTEYSEEQLQKAWEDYRVLRKDQGAGDMEQLVLNRKVRKHGDHNVMVTLASSLETNILDRFEQELVIHLRTELKNTALLLEREVEEQEMSKKLYTSKDKFEYMASQNPALRDMKERLGLDFEY